jgi:hypothetical protein
VIRDVIGAGAFASVLPDYPDGTGVTRWHFATVEDAARAVPDSKPLSAWAEPAWGAGTYRQEFTGTRNMQHARSLVLDGWKEGAEAVARITRTIALQAPIARRVARYDVAGALPCVPRFLAGDPRHMKRLDQRDTRRRPVLTLVADAASHSGVDAAAFIRAAGVAAAVTDRLEAAGFRVEVLAAMRAHGAEHGATADELNRYPQRSEIAWRAKAAEDALDASRLAVSLGHPAMLRRFCFALWSMTPQCKTDLRGTSFGRSVPLAQLTCRPAETFILPSPVDTPDDDLRAFRAALETLREQGCPGIPEELAA